MSPTTALAQAIGNHLRGYRSLIAQELRMHDAIAAALDDCGVVYEREFRLTPHDRLDFWLAGDGTAIEVKKGLFNIEDLRQVGRYLETPSVKSCILVAMRFAKNIPGEILGKPLEQVALWKYLL